MAKPNPFKNIMQTEVDAFKFNIPATSETKEVEIEWVNILLKNQQ